MIYSRKFFLLIGLVTVLMNNLEKEVGAAVTLDSSLYISERYTDNFFFTEKNRKGEYSTFVQPTLRLSFKSKNLTLTSGYRGTLEVNARNRDESGIYHRALIGLDLPGLNRQIKGLEIKVVESFSYSPELAAYSFDDATQETNDGVKVTRTNTFRNRAGLNVRYTWSLRTSSTFSYSNRITRYDSSELNDSTRNNLGFAVRFRLSPLTVVNANYEWGINHFEKTEAQVTHRAGIGADHRISVSLSMGADLGFIAFENEEHRMYLRSTIRKNLKKGRITLGFHSDVGQGGGETSTVTLNQRVTSRAIYSPNEKSSFYIQGALGKNISMPGKELENLSYEVGTGLTIQLRSWLEGSLTYEHFRQRALGTIGSDGTRNRVIATLRAVGPTWGERR